MAARSRRRSIVTELAADEGPFVSFTDLFIGILFLFLILVAALMLMHQEALQREKIERQLMQQRIEELQRKLAAVPKVDTRPAFRLGIVFNIYQRPAFGEGAWTFSRTVQVFRSPDGHCVNNVLVRSNLSTAWKPPIEGKDIPLPGQDKVKEIETCGLSAKGDHWDLPTETGDLKRVAPDLYAGGATLHTRAGDVRVAMEYRVLGIYDDYFR